MDHGRPRFNRNFTCSGLLRYLLTGHNFSRTGLSPSSVSFPKTVPLNRNFLTAWVTLQITLEDPSTPHTHRLQAYTRIQFRLLPFRSPLLRVSLRFLLLRLLRCFTSPAPPRFAGNSPPAIGFPHSDINGSLAACASPSRFAARCVLLRLQTPRLPPRALLLLSSF